MNGLINDPIPGTVPYDDRNILHIFAAMDFETANQQRTNVCSVGIAVVHAGEITDRF